MTSTLQFKSENSAPFPANSDTAHARTTPTQQRRDGALHVALIMDGNGRWAARRGLPRTAGHHAGVAALREVVEHAPRLGVGTLTVYAFSADNWRRPAAEVDALMGILSEYLQSDLERLVKAGVRLQAIGRRDRLPEHLAHHIGHAERVSAEGGRLTLRVALDYSSREAILQAARACASGAMTREALARHLEADAGDVDLLIRTSGEQRLSDFLLWECAYAELIFTPCLWPDFGAQELGAALADFHRRDRRFGALAAAAPATTSPAPTTPAALPWQSRLRWPSRLLRTVTGSIA